MLKEIINLILNLSNILEHTHTNTFLIKHFRSQKDRKQFKCLPIGEQINITWYIHTMKYYSATKKGRVLIYATTEALLDCAKLK